MLGASKTQAIVDKKVDLIRHLITLSPLTSFLKVNGFYSSFISDTSFQRLFHFEDLSMRQKICSYIIPLTIELKTTLIDILNLEKDRLISDMTHFCIEDKSDLLAISYDTMEIIQIKKSVFSGLDDLVGKQFSELEIGLFDKVDDDGFFKDIKLTSA